MCQDKKGPVFLQVCRLGAPCCSRLSGPGGCSGFSSWHGIPLVLPWLYTAWVASTPVAIHASHACSQTDGGPTRKGQRYVFLRRHLQSITPQLENESNLGPASYTSEVFSQGYYTYGNCPLLKYSLGRHHIPLLLKGFLMSHQPALFRVFL